mgnify:CR=1 FL=1
MWMLYENQSTFSVIQNPVFLPKKQNIVIAYHFVREKVADTQILPEHIPTREMEADILTKPLPVPAYTTCCNSMGIVASIL